MNTESEFHGFGSFTSGGSVFGSFLGSFFGATPTRGCFGVLGGWRIVLGGFFGAFESAVLSGSDDFPSSGSAFTGSVFASDFGGSDGGSDFGAGSVFASDFAGSPGLPAGSVVACSGFVPAGSTG